jgi:hypothetical protein
VQKTGRLMFDHCMSGWLLVSVSCRSSAVNEQGALRVGPCVPVAAAVPVSQDVSSCWSGHCNKQDSV